MFEQLTWQRGGPDQQPLLPSLKQATMVPLRLLVILLALAVSDLHSLPWFVNVSESKGPGTVLQAFTFNCSFYMPTLELLSVQPPTTFFNTPSLAGRDGIYVGKVTLSSSARLDALAVNHYELQLKYTCGNFVMQGPLFLDVHRDPGHIQCVGRFVSPAGEIIQVPETVSPGALLYTLLFPGLEVQGAQMNITSAQDPPYFPGPFSINEKGLLRVPSQGLRGQAQKVFQLQISVTFGQGQSCKGTLMVKVLPGPSSQVSFLKKTQNIIIPENLVPGSEVIQVQATGFDLRYEISSPVPSLLYSIGRADGVVRTTAALELSGTSDAGGTRLRVKAFEQLRPWASAELDLTVNVRPVNRWPPHCSPALLVTEVPEATPVGTVLSTFMCTDPDSADTNLHYQLRFHSPSKPASLCLYDRVLEPLSLLSAPEQGTSPSSDPQGKARYTLASSLTLKWPPAEVPVLVMVTPVNEFSPACAPRTFWVREDAQPYTLLGSVVGTDMDYPRNSIEYYTSGGPTVFAVDRLSGEVLLLGPLDYEQQKLYRLTVLLIDHGQDWDPTHRRSSSCTITIEVEDVNDHAPECEPPFQELTISTPLGHDVEVTKVSCQIPQEPQRLVLSYSIVGGNSQSRFRLQGAILVHNDPVLGPPWPQQPCTYELLIRVADAGSSISHLSTTATIIVHLLPWRASTIATSTHRAIVPSMMTPLLVTDTEVFWQPEPWFVVVLTVTSALLLLALGWLLSKLLQGLAQVLQAPRKPGQALLLNSIQRKERSMEGFMETPRMEMSQAPSSILNLEHFDGKAQGAREYLLFPNHFLPGPSSHPRISSTAKQPPSTLSLMGPLSPSFILQPIFVKN
ncbi:cadherin-related family member 4 isoform X3 [Heterocephalus glaber]|uniref:Cadherin-related family member 4 isoform X3 n=1 Tax=Heterocephalus glaber TaxID=10181 RepID=A0AAX6QPN4_HETGA|nr:cadherin-related family member 4 isoform X3 [Heterocephalus glaber]